MIFFRVLLIAALSSSVAWAQGAGAGPSATSPDTSASSTGAVASVGPETPVTPVIPELIAIPSGGVEAIDPDQPAHGETTLLLDISFGIRPVSPSRVNVPRGEKVTLVAPDFGAGSNCVWTKDGQAIPGAPNQPTLAIESALPADAGTYVCLFSGPANLARSSQALVLRVAPAERFINVSVRGTIAAGSGQSFVAGFVVTGPANAQKKILLRAIGPSLRQFNLANPLARPILKIHNSQGRLIWESSPQGPVVTLPGLEAALASTGAFPTLPGSGDVATLQGLPPGAYAAQVTSADGSGGEVMIEIYEVP